ncbi:MAG: AsmA family protein [Elusimicrobiaceae bacterium]|nr:AsmA family protein [Elusimicrobiaceae bacterium]
MKKLIKFLKISAIALLGLIVIGGGALYFFFPSDKIKNAAKNFIKQNYNREMDFEDASFALIGMKITKFRISEEDSFENGIFAEAEGATLKVDVLPLLSGKIRVNKLLLNGVKINIIKNVDGKFNFDNFISSGTKNSEVEQKASSSSNISVFAESIDLQNSSFHYEDKQTKMKFDIDNLNFGVQNFSLNDFFYFYLDFKTYLDMNDIKLNPVTISLQGKADLENLDLSKAYIDINPFVIAYQNAKMTFKGQMKNFTKPLLNLEGKIEGINDKVIKSITPVDLPTFALPSADLSVKADVNLESSKANISKADISLANSYIKNVADVDFSSDDLSYKANTDFHISLTDIYSSAKEMLKEIAPEGVILGNLKTASAKPYPNIEGKISLKNIGAIIADKQLKNFNGEVIIKSVKDIKTNRMSGIYNNSKFTTSIAYNQPKKPVNIDFMLDLDKFTLDDINFDELLGSSSQEPQQEQRTDTKQQDQKNDFGMYNIKADVKVKEVANNVLTANNLILKADLKNFANDLSNLQGNLTFSSENGEIRDINKLMNSSKIIKAAFSVIKVLQQVFSVAKLEKLSLGNNDTITYSEIEGAYTIQNGLINLDKSTIVSNLLTVKASGTIDLVSEGLNMKVNTHLGKVTEGSGFKPIVLKIKGTMNDPKYSVDVLSSVTSMVNVPGNILKGGAKVSTNTASGVASGLKGVASSIGKLF